MTLLFTINSGEELWVVVDGCLAEAAFTREIVEVDLDWGQSNLNWAQRRSRCRYNSYNHMYLSSK